MSQQIPLRACFSTALAVFLCSCGPQHPPPAGFVDACYGGDSAKNLNGATPKFTMTIQAREDQWPLLAQRFQEFGAAHNLQYFDTSVKAPGLHMLNVHLCTPKGLWLSADKRVWDGGPKDVEPNQMPVYLYRYGDYLDWEGIARDLEESFRDWPGTVESHWSER